MSALARHVSPRVTSLSAVASSGQVALSWPAALDALGQVRYEIWRDAGAGTAPLIELVDQLSYTDLNLTAGLTYTYSLVAKDERDLHSAALYANATVPEAADSTPDAFSFTPVTGATVSTQYTSNEVTVTGFNQQVSVQISSGGQYSKNGGAWTSAIGTAVAGDAFRVRMTSSSADSTTVSCTLFVGNTSAAFSITTQSGSGVPLFFIETWESGLIDSNLWNLSSDGSNASTAVSTVRSRAGQRAIRNAVSGNTSTFRAEIRARTANDQPFQEDLWYGFSMYLEPHGAGAYPWEIFAQWHKTSAAGTPDEGEDSGNPYLKIGGESYGPNTSSRMELRGLYNQAQPTNQSTQQTAFNVDLGPIENFEGGWIDVIVHLRWDWRTDGVGRCEIWFRQNNVLTRHVNYTGPLGPNDVQGPYVKFGIYREHPSSPLNAYARVVFHDEFRFARGPNVVFADVDPATYAGPQP